MPLPVVRHLPWLPCVTEVFLVVVGLVPQIGTLSVVAVAVVPPVVATPTEVAVVPLASRQGPSANYATKLVTL
jgi:hypothetical protein